MALLVAHCPLAGEEPGATEGGSRGLGRVPVAGEEGRGAAVEREVALGAGRKHVPVGVDHADLVAGGREPDRARADRGAPRVRDQNGVLGLPEAVPHGDPEGILERAHRFLVGLLAHRDRVPESPGLDGAGGRDCISEEPVFVGRLAQDRDAEPLQQIESLLGVEGAFVDHDLGAASPRAEEEVPAGLRAVRACGAPDEVAGACLEPVLGGNPLRPGRAVGVGDAHLPAGLRRVQDDRGVLRGRVMRRLQDRCLPELRRHFLGDHDVQRHVHQGDGARALAVGDDESRAGVLGPPRQVAGLHACGARHDHEPALQRSEQDRDPRRRPRREDEQAVSGREPPVAQQRRPTVRLPRDLRERAPVDDPVTVDVRQRRIQRIGRVGLDNIARVVEPRRNLPDAFERRCLVYALAEELSHVSRHPSRTSGRCRSLLRRR